MPGGRAECKQGLPLRVQERRADPPGSDRHGGELGMKRGEVGVVQERRVGQPVERRQRHVELAIHGITEHPDGAEHVLARALPLPAVELSISTALRTSTGTRLATTTQSSDRRRVTAVV